MNHSGSVIIIESPFLFEGFLDGEIHIYENSQILK
jgi:hypothetical protein